jgi:hypothetical protein
MGLPCKRHVFMSFVISSTSSHRDLYATSLSPGNGHEAISLRLGRIQEKKCATPTGFSMMELPTSRAVMLELEMPPHGLSEKGTQSRVTLNVRPRDSSRGQYCNNGRIPSGVILLAADDSNWMLYRQGQACAISFRRSLSTSQVSDRCVKF